MIVMENNHTVQKEEKAVSPLVSVITIVLNGEASIRRTIESVLGQSYSNIEYIVIDGGSTDNTVAIIKEYEDRITQWQSVKDHGISDGFNKGIRLARGEITGLIKAGAWYLTDTVQCVVDTFKKEVDLGVLCGAVQFYKGEEKAYLCFSEPDLLEKEMSVTHPSCFVRSELYSRFGLFSGEFKFAMDYEILLRLKVNGAQFLSIDRALANMQHDGVAEKHWREALAETHRARNELLGKSLYTSNFYFYFLVLKRRIRIFLERSGCDSLIAFYRARLAFVKKTKT